jgi:acetyl-CoA carboxylase biotin carboxyl carrier protein
MNKKEIEELITFVSEAGVSEVSLETKEIKITIKTHRAQQAQVYAQPDFATGGAPSPSVTPAVSSKAEASPPAASAPKPDESKLHVIKSPMIGTFYRTPHPDKPNFVSVGDEVKPGSIICIIEAMKLFNEIECDVTGKIVKVLVDNASPVEYDQPLFLVEPA